MGIGTWVLLNFRSSAFGIKKKMKKIILFVILALVALGGLTTYQYFKFHDGKLHVVFCNVGQGDGIFITTPSNKHILVDAGPDESILNCLSSHMPFWERKIDLSILTHPHADHLMGYYFVAERYNLTQFATEKLNNKSDGFNGLLKQLDKQKIKVQHVAAGDKWRFADGVIFLVEGPTDEFLFRKNPDGFITNSAESASLVTQLTYGNFSVLLTGDAPVDEMTDIAGRGVGSLNVLQIPHHGSSTGVDGHVIDLLAPPLAVISVGAHNKYGHPTKQTLGLLKERGLKVLRTDQMGDVEFVSDGKM